MHRFFISPQCIDGDAVTLSGPVARQLARVLRSRPGDRVVLLDDSGWEYLVTLTVVRSGQVLGLVADRLAPGGEPNARITLYQAVLKADRFELVLQKGTELGVSAFVPMFCARSVPRARESASKADRHDRWQRIVTEAAEQSGRGRIPTLERPMEFFKACDAAQGLAIIPWEEERETGLKTVLARLKAGSSDGSSVSIFVGPEGGFTREEVDYARARGLVPVSLGDRILRAETAGIAAVAAIQYEAGELGG